MKIPVRAVGVHLDELDIPLTVTTRDLRIAIKYVGNDWLTGVLASFDGVVIVVCHLCPCSEDVPVGVPSRVSDSGNFVPPRVVL